MNILVAGGAGFIGSHLCDALLGAGHDVICVDKLVFRHHDNIDHLVENSKFTFIQTDLGQMDQTEKVFKDNKIDIVYHLAANSDIQKGGIQPEIDFRETFMTTRNILEAMRLHGVKKLFFSSTSAIYGEMCDVEIREDAGDMKPVSYYGGAKLASEAYISSYSAMNDMQCVIFRFPNVIGSRLTHGAVFDFVKKLRINSGELEILGDGTQCKPYIHISDLISAIMERTKDWQPGVELYNVSVLGGGTSVTRIAEIVVKTLGLSEVAFSYTGGDRGWKGDVPRFSYDISKILATGWKPQYTSDEAVRKTVEEIKEA